MDDPEPKYGLSVVGMVEPGKQVTNAGAKVGDSLILSKPLGTASSPPPASRAGLTRLSCRERWDNMATLNRAASEAMTKVGVHSCTDITGFGLMGHLKSMVKGSGVCAEINLGSVPTLPGTWELLEQGIAHRRQGRNRTASPTRYAGTRT